MLALAGVHVGSTHCADWVTGDRGAGTRESLTPAAVCWASGQVGVSREQKRHTRSAGDRTEDASLYVTLHRDYKTAEVL